MNAMVRLLTIAAICIGCLIAGGVAAAVSAQWLVVRVETKGDDSLRLFVPVPLWPVKMATLFLPDQARSFELPPDLPIDPAVLQQVAAILASCPDTVFASVSTPREDIRVAKQGESLIVFVKTEDATVDLRLPLPFVQRCLAGMADGQVKTAGLAAALSSLRFTRLADIRSPGADVTVWSW